MSLWIFALIGVIAGVVISCFANQQRKCDRSMWLYKSTYGLIIFFVVVLVVYGYIVS